MDNLRLSLVIRLDYGFRTDGYETMITLFTVGGGLNLPLTVNESYGNR